MKRKVLSGVSNPDGQPMLVTIGSTGVKEAGIIDPDGPLTIPGGHTPESKLAMSEYIRKRKNGEINVTYNPE